MDFIEQLPKSLGYTDILVVVDRLTKQAIFILTQRSINAIRLVEIFVRNIFSKHGVLSYVTSDWGTEFVSKFFRALAATLNMRLYFTLGYHPEANSQTKQTNQTLEQYLRIYCNYQQLDWVQLLLLVEFTYNNIPSPTTGFSSFFANKDYYPQLDIQLNQASHPDIPHSDTAQYYSSNLAEIHTKLK